MDNPIQEPSSAKEEGTSVRVVVRVRPFLPQESEEKSVECVFVRSELQQVQVGQSKTFTFDRVYDSRTEQARLFVVAAFVIVVLSAENL